ncbi:hypothetical protein N9903_01865, partial [bacterium]|nr:hypothetical protein [bacterium]
MAFAISFAAIFSPDSIATSRFYGDDASYLSHAFTLGLDFDLDYANEPAHVYGSSKIMPSHPIGTGIMAAPFVALGGLADRITGHPVIVRQKLPLGSWSLLGFFAAANIYFLSGIFLYWKGLASINRTRTMLWTVVLFAMSTGVPYYVLRRFTMAHAFEFFGCAAVFFSVSMLYRAVALGRKRCFWLVSCSLLTSLNIFIRYSNLNLLLLPPAIFLIVRFIDREDEHPALDRRKFWKWLALVTVISLLAYVPFGFFSNHYFGSYFPSIKAVYGVDARNIGTMSLAQKVGALLALSPNIFKLFFSSEMGILYTNPVVAVGIPFLLFTAVRGLLRRRSAFNFLLLLSIAGFSAFSFAIVLWWKSTGSSYGYRYLFPLIPLGMVGA